MQKIEENNFAENKVSDDIKKEIKLFNMITERLLNIFTRVNISLHEQLSSLASLSFLLFFIKRRNKTEFLTYDLYHDIQFTIQDSYWAVYLFQKYLNRFDEDLQCFLYQLGTDQLESLFGVIPTQSHSRNFSLYEL